MPGEVSQSKLSDRFHIERALVEGFLARDKPVFGICAGMQMLACLHGCRLTSDLRAMKPNALEHDRRGYVHRIDIAAGSRLAGIVEQSRLDVNSFHREAVAHLAPDVVASAHAEDGIVEAIEIPARRFAVGIQWHQELLGRLRSSWQQAVQELRAGILLSGPPQSCITTGSACRIVNTAWSAVV